MEEKPREDVIRALMEMFPHLSREQATKLADSGDDISVLVTRVLDNNIDRPFAFLSDATVHSRSAPRIYREYNYPEIFQARYSDPSDHPALREKARDFFEKARGYRRETSQFRMRGAREFYSVEADDLRARARDCNRRAAVLIMREALGMGWPIDLHGLYLEEAIGFIDDLYARVPFREASFITGSEYNSTRLRPAVTQWLQKRHFRVLDEGPLVRGTKPPH